MATPGGGCGNSLTRGYYLSSFQDFLASISEIGAMSGRRKGLRRSARPALGSCGPASETALRWGRAFGAVRGRS